MLPFLAVWRCPDVKTMSCLLVKGLEGFAFQQSSDKILQVTVPVWTSVPLFQDLGPCCARGSADTLLTGAETHPLDHHHRQECSPFMLAKVKTKLL